VKRAVIVALALLLSACTDAVVNSPSSRSSPPDPISLGGLMSQLDCSGRPQAIGGDAGEIAPVGAEGTASPSSWLYAEDALDLPLEGWTEQPKVSWESGAADRVRFVNLVDGRVKAVIIMAGHSVPGGAGRWSVVAFRACQPNEFDPLVGRTTDDAPWADSSGVPAPGVEVWIGPSHCGWESTIWLHLDDGRRLYLRDPVGVLRDATIGPFLASTRLPAVATSTGWRSRDRELYLTPDPGYVYVQTPDAVERWPRAIDPMMGCA
jgi:hypothetical protein